jgi:putative protease
MDRIELLAPAKDLECGLAAINCGADAVYIGAQRFGARENAGNTLEDIGALIRYAHKYWARVYVTVNTLLHNDEIPLAQRLIFQIHEIGADGVMIQDVGLLECDLPPIPLIASTQMHNNTPEKAAFLQEVGIRRVILARELSLTEIKAIRRAAPRIELECFVHGALCVSYSGQCYLSYALGGRSGNRGQCAQPCRKPYTLVDGSGRVIERKRHLLSLRDLNLSEYLEELIEVGVCSFKIEGRLRDKTYVANVVAHYRARLDEILGRKGLRKSSSGTCKVGFVPDVEKTFNRGYTTHFLHGRSGDTGTPDTPKMVGTPAGKVMAVDGRRVILDADIPLYPGDGICFFNRNRELCGTFLKAVDGRAIVPNTIEGIIEGMLVFRNRDQNFLARIKKSRPERRIAVALTLREIPDGFCLAAEDEDGNRAEGSLHCVKEPADKPEQALTNIQKQIQRMGGTEFSCSSVEIALPRTYFLPISSLNALRRRVLERLAAVRRRCPERSPLSGEGTFLSWKRSQSPRRRLLSTPRCYPYRAGRRVGSGPAGPKSNDHPLLSEIPAWFLPEGGK